MSRNPLEGFLFLTFFQMVPDERANNDYNVFFFSSFYLPYVCTKLFRRLETLDLLYRLLLEMIGNIYIINNIGLTGLSISHLPLCITVIHVIWHG